MQYRTLIDFIFMFLFSVFLFSANSEAGTCTSISRTNFSANSVLTSTDLNSQFNTVYNQVNAFDGGCVTDGTLEVAAIDTSEWAPVLNAVKEGCKVSYSNASTLSVGKCYMAVNGNFVRTTSANTVAFGCTGCASEAATSDYYVYAKTGSSDSTLNLLISSTAPSEDGYDSSSNRILARFHNDGSSDIDQYSIDQWRVSGFVPQRTGWLSYTPSNTQGFGDITGVSLEWRRNETDIEIRGYFNAGTTTTDEAQLGLPQSYSKSGSAVEMRGFWTRSQSSNTHGGIVTVTGGDNFMNFSASGVFGSDTVSATTAATGQQVISTGNKVNIDGVKLEIGNWNYD